jgi:tetratricopeptide (TPR) repeat protein
MPRPTLSSLILATALIFPALASSQRPALIGPAKTADDVARAIDRAYFTGDLAGLQAVRRVIDHAVAEYPNDPLLLHYQGYELYREANQLLAANRGAEAAPLLTRARDVLQRSIALRSMPESHALLSTVLGEMIGADQSLDQTLGPLSGQEMQTAVAAGPLNPRVWLLRGIGTFYTPPQYGGGIANAESQLRRAVALFATDFPVAPAPSWGQAEAYAWLGQVLQKENKPTEAAAAYDRALALQPGYTWVKTELLPSVTR